MKIASINAQGFNSPSKHVYLIDFIKKHNIDIIAVQEVSSPVNILNDPEYDAIFNSPTHPHWPPLNKGEGKIADYIKLKKSMVELRKEKLFGRLVRGRLTQPIEEEEVGAAHLTEEKKKGENKTIEALT